MTRRDFALIASCIADMIAKYAECGETDLAFEDLARSMADKLATTNGRFDRVKFLQACGVCGVRGVRKYNAGGV